jgi:hypothetical protein
MSALPPKADIAERDGDVPEAEVATIGTAMIRKNLLHLLMRRDMELVIPFQTAVCHANVSSSVMT